MTDTPATAPRTLTVGLIVALAVFGIVSFGCFLANAWHVALLLERIDTPDGEELGLNAADSLVMTAESLQSIAGLIAFVVLVIWATRTVKRLRTSGAEGVTFTPARTVAAFLIPVLNLWQPYQVMRQLSAALLSGQSTGPLAVWWGLTIAGVVLVIATAVYGLTAATLSQFAILGTLSIAVHLVSAVGTTVLIRWIYPLVSDAAYR